MCLRAIYKRGITWWREDIGSMFEWQEKIFSCITMFFSLKCRYYF